LISVFRIVFLDWVVKLVTLATSDRLGSIAFRDDPLLLWSLTSIRRSQSPADPLSGILTATDCALSICLKRLRSEYKNGTLSELEEVVSADITPGSLTQVLFVQPDTHPNSLSTIPYYYPRSDLQLASRYNTSQAAINGIVKLLADTFNRDGNGSIAHTDRPSGHFSSKSISNDDDSLADWAPEALKSIYQSRNLSATFANLARSMTNNMRSNDDTRSVEYGMTSTTAYKINWTWICLPLMGLLGETIFLGLTMLCSRGPLMGL